MSNKLKPKVVALIAKKDGHMGSGEIFCKKGCKYPVTKSTKTYCLVNTEAGIEHVWEINSEEYHEYFEEVYGPTPTGNLLINVILSTGPSHCNCLYNPEILEVKRRIESIKDSHPDLKNLVFIYNEGETLSIGGDLSEEEITKACLVVTNNQVDELS